MPSLPHVRLSRPRAFAFNESRAEHRWHAPCARRLDVGKPRSLKDGAGAPTLHRAKDLAARRLLSPDEAARYLGLGSRWAIRRLVVSGDLPLVRVAGKWRFDLADLDRLIASLKCAEANSRTRRSSRHDHPRPEATLPARLAPLAPRSHRVVTGR
jgi:excisionase family DNA binding protein